jgi:MFS family permease
VIAAIHSRLPATRHRDFRALWGGTASSAIALWTLLLGNAWIVKELSDSNRWVALSTFASMSPFLLAPFGGVIADKFDRRILVRWTRVAALGVTLALFLLALTGVLNVWMVIGLALLQGCVRAVEIPSDQALLAAVVPTEDIGNAVTLSTMTQQGSRAVGPLLAAPFLTTVGVEGAYGVAALFTLLSFTSIWRVRTSSYGGVAQLGAVIHNLAEGVRYVRHTGPVLAVFLLVSAHCALTMSYDAMLPGFASDHLHQRSAFSLLNAGVGIGALIGTAWLSFWPSRRRGRIYLLAGLASGVTTIMMSLAGTVPTAVTTAVLMGASQVPFMALSAVLLQEVVPDAVRGRVMSFYLMSAGGIMAFANLGFGSLADVVEVPALFLLPGALFTVIMLTTLVAGSNLRRTYRTGRVSGSLPASAAVGGS